MSTRFLVVNTAEDSIAMYLCDVPDELVPMFQTANGALINYQDTPQDALDSAIAVLELLDPYGMTGSMEHPPEWSTQVYPMNKDGQPSVDWNEPVRTPVLIEAPTSVIHIHFG